MASQLLGLGPLFQQWPGEGEQQSHLVRGSCTTTDLHYTFSRAGPQHNSQSLEHIPLPPSAALGKAAVSCWTPPRGHGPLNQGFSMSASGQGNHCCHCQVCICYSPARESKPTVPPEGHPGQAVPTLQFVKAGGQGTGTSWSFMCPAGGLSTPEGKILARGLIDPSMGLPRSAGDVGSQGL